jgi:hypothetical protein
LDILAQYWQFLAQPKNPKSGEYGFSKSDMKRFGADEGLRVYKALENAADRKIKIRQVLLLLPKLEEFYYGVYNQCESFICLDLMVKNREISIERYFKWWIRTKLV